MSLRKAINNKCRECLYDPKGGNGTWLNQVADCTSFSCALHSVRPTPRDRLNNERAVILARESDHFDVFSGGVG
jgi:hypothetical protein